MRCSAVEQADRERHEEERRTGKLQTWEAKAWRNELPEYAMIIDGGALMGMPTLHVGQDSDLKIDTRAVRVWLSRMRMSDGETEPVQVEELHNGRWEKIASEGDYPIAYQDEIHHVRLLTGRF